MIDYIQKILTGQFEAALCMLNDCIQICPPALWEGKIAFYPFWQVAYHTLSYCDYYLSPGEAAFEPRDFHPPQEPGSMFNDEPVPDQGFTPAELGDYLSICRKKAIEAFASETPESLQRDCAFRRRTFSRGELHIYNLRHIQHHTGQLSAYLRKMDSALDPRWVGSGWK
jgi:hypothetical protein